MTNLLLDTTSVNLALGVSALSLLVSTVSAGVSIYVARRDRTHVDVSFSHGQFHWQGRGITGLVIVSAANRGRRPVVLSSYLFEFSKGDRIGYVPYPVAPLPKRLEEGEAYTNFVTLRSLQEALQQRPKGTRLTAIAFNTADGRVYRRLVSRWSRWQSDLRRPLAPEPENLNLLDPYGPLREMLSQLTT